MSMDKQMKKIIAPEGYRVLRAKEIIRLGDLFYQPAIATEIVVNEAGKTADHVAIKYGYTSCYTRKIEKPAKPKKTRPKKSLAQIAYDAFWNGCGMGFDRQSVNDKKDWQSAANAVAREVRKQIKQQKEQK